MYRGHMRVFTVCDRDGFPVAHGAQFTDGRVALERSGVVSVHPDRNSATDVFAGAVKITSGLLPSPFAGHRPLPRPRRFVITSRERERPDEPPSVGAEGAVFPDGQAVVVQIGAYDVVCVWRDMALVVDAYHEVGVSEVQWLDQ